MRFLLTFTFLFAVIGGRAQVPVGLRLDPQHLGAQIPADFVGLSFEMQRVLADTNGGHFFSATNKALIATFQALGIKSLRVGGNTADRPTLPTPTMADVDALFQFAQAANVKVIYTLRLNRGEPGAAAEMAGHISRHYAGLLDCFSIGNEPNVFSTNFEVYFTEWNRFAAQITAATNSPGATFCGPGVSPGHEKWSGQFAQRLAGSGLIKYISQHDYAGGDARKVTNPAGARDKILSTVMEANYKKFAANFVPAVQSNGFSYRFEEANSFYDGGALDVSDTYAAALWALNYQWWWAEHGMRGINFHTGDKVAARDENKPCRYASFWTATNGYNVHPVGYAEKMFSLGSAGRLVPAGLLPPGTTNENFRAYAVRADNGELFVTLINFSHGAGATNYAAQLEAREVSGWSEGKLMRLDAPDGDVSRKTGVTLGGAEIADDASWKGQWESIIAPSDSRQFPLTVTVPPASAVLVKLTPKK